MKELKTRTKGYILSFLGAVLCLTFIYFHDTSSLKFLMTYGLLFLIGGLVCMFMGAFYYLSSFRE